MKNNVFGADCPQYKKIVSKRVLYCVLSVFLLIVLNISCLLLRGTIGKTLSMIINILLDVFVLSVVTMYYDFNVSKDLTILKLYKQKINTFSGVIDEVNQTPITYSKLKCYVVVINNKKYYSPINSKIEFIVNKSAVISTVKNIILEVSYE